MTKKFIYTLSYSFLFFACTESQQAPSDQLEISWNPLPDYHYYLYTPEKGTLPAGKSDYNFSNGESSAIYPWDTKGIELYGLALDKQATEHGIYPEATPQGFVHLKLSGQNISPTYNEILLAKPQSVKAGEAKVRLEFKPGMSLLYIDIEGASEYQFDIRIEAVEDGYIDLQKGEVIADGKIKEIYFSSAGRSVPVIPQTLASDTKIYITGRSSDGQMVRTNYPLTDLVLKSNCKYTWTFGLDSGKLTFRKFSETPRK